MGIKNKMIGKNKEQFDVFDNIIFDKLIKKEKEVNGKIIFNIT